MSDQTEQVAKSFAAEKVFACVRFAGGRFDSHIIPLDVLPDLAAYQRLVVEVAKMLFKNNNGTRVRVPKGFEESFQIGIRRIEGGQSAVAEMPRFYPPEKQLSLQFAANDNQYAGKDYREFDDAREYIDKLIDTVGSTGNVPADFPIELAGFFNPFGQNLRSDEFAELGFGTEKRVRYDTFIRKKIVLSREKTYENSVNSVFTLDGGAIDAGVIHVLDASGSTFDFRPPTEFEFNKAYNRARETVRLVGTGLYDKNERLRRLLDVNVVYEDGGAKQPFEERLKEITDTSAGWYDDTNPAPSPKAIEAIRKLLLAVPPEKSIPMPYLYPKPNGGISGEWSIGNWEASAEIDPAADTLELSAVDVLSQQDLFIQVKIDSLDLMMRFMEFMGQISADEGSGNAN
jgi:hypothetical protein